MSPIASLEAELETLRAFLRERGARDTRALAEFLGPRLRLDNAPVLAAQLPCPLEDVFPETTPIETWARPMHTRLDVRPRSPAEESEYQWSHRYPVAVVATRRGWVAPIGWTPRPLMTAVASADSWDRCWALSEIVRLGMPPAERLDLVVEALSDEAESVRWWAWLAAIRWAEIVPKTPGLADAIARRAPSADPSVAPLAAWAAMLVGRTDDLTPALARCLAEPSGTTAEALEIVRRLGARLEDLGALIEPLIDAEDRGIVCSALYALVQNAPGRWARVWAFTAETQLHVSRGRLKGGEQQATWVGPSSRATTARFALEDAASRLGPEAAAVVVAHADEAWVLPIRWGR